VPIQNPPPGAKAFSLIELLAVVGIIAILVALLAPVIADVRRSARSTRCLANLQQWGQAFQMYLSAGSGRQPTEVNPNDPTSLEWWEQLSPYAGDVSGILTCPDAAEPRPGPPDRTYKTFKKGRAAYAWRVVKRGTDWHGSYGFNVALYDHRDDYPPYFHFPVREAGRIPVLGDCCGPRTLCVNGEDVPKDLQYPCPDHGGGVAEYCIDRHTMAANLVFLDGHAERVPLAKLWTLKWTNDFVPRTVVVPRP
jgi:prepilin-type N-terminal cleavage/methylation domain-containing protein/prepilin-type processing-associated H-X9-DG protein